MKISEKLLFITALLTIVILSSCERLNMYDIASQKSRTAYAIAFDGANYSLILANIHYTKTTILTPGFALSLYGISVNEKGEIIVFDSDNTYLIQSDLQSWEQVAPRPDYNNVIGYNNTFIYLIEGGYTIEILNKNTSTWDTMISTSFNSQTIFKGLHSQIYLISFNFPNLYFYSITDISAELFSVPFYALPTPWKALQTDRYFYVWSLNPASTTNSIFRITPESITVLNGTNQIGTSLQGLTVTDNDMVYAIVMQGLNIILKEIISDGNYPEILNLGTSGYFTIDSLDDRHIVLSSSGNTSGYNGLIIYDVIDKKIVKHVTKNNIISLYVRR